MKVKIGELKTHLSKYLRQLEQGEGRIDVCVREDTVAYLTSARSSYKENAEKRDLEKHLESAGIEVSQWGTSQASPIEQGGTCENPAEGPNSIERIRRERNW